MQDSDSGIGIDSGMIPESCCFCLKLESRKSNCVGIGLGIMHLSPGIGIGFCDILVELESKNVDWHRNWSGIREFVQESELNQKFKNAGIRIKICPEMCITDMSPPCNIHKWAQKVSVSTISGEPFDVWTQIWFGRESADGHTYRHTDYTIDCCSGWRLRL